MPVWFEHGVAWALATAVLLAGARHREVMWRIAVVVGLPTAAVLIEQQAHVAGALDCAVAVGLLVARLPLRPIAADRALAGCALAIPCLRIALATPVGFHAERAMHDAFVAPLSLAGVDLHGWGPSVSGTRFVLLAVIVVALGGPPPWKNRVAVAAGLAFAGLVGAALTEMSLAAGLPFGSDDAGREGLLLACEIPWLPVICVLGAAVLLAARNRAGRAVGMLPLSMAALAAVTGLAVDPRAPSAGAPADWMVLERGLVSWGRPTTELYGQESGGMLGTLPEFITATGGTSSFRSSLLTLGPGQGRGLIAINTDEPLDAAERAEVQRFVEEGGWLLVVGDHTFLKSRTEADAPTIPLNDLLGDTAIRFENDSADPFVPGWSDATVVLRRGAPIGPAPANPLGAVVGGALTIEWPAAPLVVGRFGYRDVGITARDAKRGFLGDLLWNRGEPFGDIVLAASQRIGAGRVVVVGDTTGVMNLGRPLAWRWWSAVLTEKGGATPWLVLGALALLGGGVLAVAPRLRLAIGRHSDLAAAVAGVLLASVGAVREPPGRRIRPEHPLAVVELSACPDGKSGSWSNEGRLSLLTGLHRSGFLPVLGGLGRDELEDAANLVLLAAPQAPLGESETARVLAWVRRGGTCVVGASHGQASNVSSLLLEAGIRVSGEALGPCRGEWSDVDGTQRTASFLDAWALSLDGGRAMRVVAVNGRPIVAQVQLGAGRVIIIGDARFLSNAALEGRWGHNQGNVDLFRFLTAPRP